MELIKAMPSSFFPIYLVSSELYLCLVAVAFLVVLLVTPLVKRVALTYGWVDLPSARKVHAQPIARVGGISIFLGTALALAVWLFCGMLGGVPSEEIQSFYAIMLGAAAFFLLGLADDLVSLSPFVRLVMQTAITSLVWLAGVRVDLSDWIDVSFLSTDLAFVCLDAISALVTVFWLVGVVNALNWMDGLDGLATGIGGIAAAVSFAIFCSNGQLLSAVICLALLGSLAGFLAFNFNPAQIFMGDGGAYFVGFSLASVSITGFADSTSTLSTLFPLLVLAVPLGDMTFVIVSRLSRRVSPFLADKSHVHHRLLQRGVSHSLTVVLLYTLSGWIGSVALVIAKVPNSTVIMGCMTGMFVWVSYRASGSVRNRVSFTPELENMT